MCTSKKMELLNAIQRGESYQNIKNLVTSCPDTNYSSPEGITYLEAAVLHGNSEVVQLLLEYKADIFAATSAQTKTLANTFFKFVREQRTDPHSRLQMLELLLDNGLSLSKADDYPTIQPEVLQATTFDIFMKLLELKMVVHDVSHVNYYFPIRAALDNEDHRIWQYILDHNLVDLNETDHEGKTVLMVMAPWPDKAKIEILVKAGANPNDFDHDLNTPLTLSMYETEVTQNFRFLFSVSDTSNITLAFARALSLNLVDYIEFMVKSIAKSNYLNPQPIVSHLGSLFRFHFRLLFQECTYELENTLSEIVKDQITLRDILFTEDVRIYLSNSALCYSIPKNVQRSNLVHYHLELNEKLKIIHSMFKLKLESGVQLSKLMKLQDKSLPNIINKIASYLSENDLINLQNLILISK